jgi:predicted RNase H-like HicB family nuclease
MVTMPINKCAKCSHEWIPRVPNHRPRKCPNCQSPNWEKDLKVGEGTAQSEEQEVVKPVPVSELVFEVTEEAEGGYSAECLTENIFTQGDTWEELRANVREATEAFYFDTEKPRYIRLHLVRNEVLTME